MPPDGSQRGVLGQFGDLILVQSCIVRDVDEPRPKMPQFEVHTTPVAHRAPCLRQPVRGFLTSAARKYKFALDSTQDVKGLRSIQDVKHRGGQKESLRFSGSSE